MVCRKRLLSVWVLLAFVVVLSLQQVAEAAWGRRVIARVAYSRGNPVALRYLRFNPFTLRTEAPITTTSTTADATPRAPVRVDMADVADDGGGPVATAAGETVSLLGLRPPIRVPYRPPLRSPFRPPLP